MHYSVSYLLNNQVLCCGLDHIYGQWVTLNKYVHLSVLPVVHNWEYRHSDVHCFSYGSRIVKYWAWVFLTLFQWPNTMGFVPWLNMSPTAVCWGDNSSRQWTTMNVAAVDTICDEEENSRFYMVNTAAFPYPTMVFTVFCNTDNNASV